MGNLPKPHGGELDDLMLPGAAAEILPGGGYLALRDPEGATRAPMKVLEVWVPDLEEEAAEEVWLYLEREGYLN